MTQQTTDPITGDAPLEPFSEKLIPEDRELPPNLKEIVERAIELHRETRELESRAKENRAELQRLDPVIIEQFGANQIQQQKMRSGETIYPEKSVYTSLIQDDNGEHTGAHQALLENGLEWLVKDKVDSSSLSAWVREQRRLETEIPEGLLPFLKISEVYRVKVRL